MIGKVAGPKYAARVADTGFRLGIDFGTSNTVGVLRWPDGRTKSLLFDGSPLLPSAVYAEAGGTILSGRDAVHSARLQPHRFEPYPKRRIEDGNVWLGERDIPVIDLIAAVLRRVATEATRVAGSPPSHVTITHPAAWGPQRRETLSRATVAAGLPVPQLSPEPVAAASYFVGTVGTHVPVGGNAVVYDFGAGTFDASVVRRGANGGFEVLSSEGLPDAGGLDVDAAIVGYLGRSFEGHNTEEWERITQPETENDRRAAWQLWEDARLAKEMLSRAATTYVHVPMLDESVPIGREQLEQLARPILDRTVTATQLAVTSAGITNSQLAAIFLVGGSSRIPLAATLLHRAFGLAPTAIEQPELVVAEGSLYLAPPRTGRAMVAGAAGLGPSAPVSVSGPPVPARPVSGPPVPVPRSSSGPPASAPVSASPFQIPSSVPSAAFPPSADEPSVDFAADPGAQAGPGAPIPPPQGPDPAFSNDPTQLVRPASGPPAGFPAQGYVPPGQARPVSGQPAQAYPGQPAPTLPMPSQPGPQGFGAQPMPVQPAPYSGAPSSAPPYTGPPSYQAPGQPVSGQPQSGQPYPAQPYSGQPFSGQPYSAQPYSAQPYAAQPVSGIGQPAPGRPAFGAPPVPPQNPNAGWQPGYPGVPPPKRRGRTMALSVGGGAIALLLLVVGIAWAAGGFGGKPTTNGSPSANGGGGGGAAPACGYKIAFLGVMTGDNNGDGTMVDKSAKMAIDEYNADPKHAECGVTLSEFDTKQADDTSATTAQQIADDPKILGVVGPIYRNEMLSAAPILDKAGVSLITPSASDAELSRKGWKVFHRLLGTDADQADAGVTYLQTVLKTTKTYIVADDTEFGTTGGTEARRKLGSSAVGTVNVGRDDKDFAAAVKQVTDSGADSVYCACYFDDGATIIKAIRTAKPNITVMSGDRIFTQSFLDGTGTQGQGVYMTCPCIPADQAGNNFAADYKAKYSEQASYYGPEAFDAANIYLAGLQAGAATRSAMLAFVNGYSGRGVSRSIKFTVNGDLNVSSLDIWAYKVDGQYVVKDRVIPGS